jgi:nucleoside-diphosphate-sugar epimerase
MTLYGETKAEAETLVRDAGNSISFRYATAFGVSPCMRFDLLLNDFALQAVRDDALDVYEGGFRRTFIHVRDMARAIAFALERWNDFHRDVYNVGHESLNLTKAEVAERISRHVGCRLTLSDAGSDPDRRDYEVSYERLRATGFTTTVGLDDGILELVTAARSALDPNAEGPNGDG